MDHLPGRGSVLIATLGGQPQVVTFAMDALLEQGEVIDAVYLLHMSTENPRTHKALATVLREFENGRYGALPCHVHRVALAEGAKPLQDIQSAADAETTWRVIRDLISDLKQKRHLLHICVAGGRRMMALLTMSAAALLCDHQDRLWHMYTPEEVRKRADSGALMHLEADAGMQLIQVPLVPWGSYFPALRALAQTTPEDVRTHMRWLSRAEESQCRMVFERLTERQKEVLSLFACGRRPQEVAHDLNIGLATVNSHKTAILAECRVAWNLSEGTRLDYHYLREQFAAFAELEGFSQEKA